MWRWQRHVSVAILGFALLLPVHGAAQDPAAPMYMTGCITREGESRNWNTGLLPLRPCARGESQVTLALKAAVDAQSAAGSKADVALQGNIDREAATRSAADAALQQQITSNTDAISLTAARVTAAEAEIVGTANDYGNSRIDTLSTAAGEIVGVIWSGEGGIEDPSNFYRTLTLNGSTGELAVRGEIDHGLDYVANDGYWYCTIADQIANGDIQQHVENLPDDHAELTAVGLGEYYSHWWSFKFENTQGPDGKSPFARIQVWNPNTDRYVEVRPTDAHPVTGWIMGRRSSNGLTPERAVRVALSDSQLRALIASLPEPFTLGTGDNHVLVDLNYSVAKLR